MGGGMVSLQEKFCQFGPERQTALRQRFPHDLLCKYRRQNTTAFHARKTTMTDSAQIRGEWGPSPRGTQRPGPAKPLRGPFSSSISLSEKHSLLRRRSTSSTVPLHTPTR